MTVHYQVQPSCHNNNILGLCRCVCITLGWGLSKGRGRQKALSFTAFLHYQVCSLNNYRFATSSLPKSCVRNHEPPYRNGCQSCRILSTPREHNTIHGKVARVIVVKIIVRGICKFVTGQEHLPFFSREFAQDDVIRVIDPYPSVAERVLPERTSTNTRLMFSDEKL